MAGRALTMGCMLLCAALASPTFAVAQATPVPAPSVNPPDVLSKVERRHRLAHCAAQWQKMKRTGADVHLIWREFSATCMAQAASTKPPAARASADAPAQAAVPARP